ncbi:MULTISPECIES: glycosyltransferase family 4 protein [Spirulina sp. CCY15215]|uniref:glycosyltransferase family 4 protein n=1 Tax=Spirulina sp. CCY15215 TaxID=2767591 RepID=UPI001950639E|nr:glycosyltransferase family 4 protein [Spirulina major]
MSSQTKISLLSPNLHGGAATRVYLLAKVLQQLDFNVKVFGCLFEEQLYPIPPKDLPLQWVKGCNYPQFFQSVQELIQAIDGDIIYAVKPKPTSFGIGLLKRFLSKRPLLLDIDDWELSWFGGDDWQYQANPKKVARDILKKNGALRDPQHPLYLRWCEQLVAKADLVTIDTEFLRNRYGGIYLPNGKDTRLFDPEKFNPEESRAKYGLSEYRVLMFPGTARPHKGIEDVIEALNLLDRPDLRFVLVGGTPIGDGYLEQLLEKGKPWLIKLPSIPLDEMPEVVAAAHIVIVPQRDTPVARAQFPIKLGDGMAMAKPVISTRVGDIPDILGETGFLADPSSPQQIATQIEAIFQNYDEAIARGRKARERCVQYYSVDAMAAILKEAIANLSG